VLEFVKRMLDFKSLTLKTPLRCPERGTLRRDKRPPVRGRTGRASLHGGFPWASPNLGAPTAVRRNSVSGFACDGRRLNYRLVLLDPLAGRSYSLGHRALSSSPLIRLRRQWTAPENVDVPSLGALLDWDLYP